ncbi:PEP-CTERM sorting domain-containing protein [Kiritimatiellaeota bacterium B1221]|nr:PEP-CTERM sorting domain-containing protein [Kiritimatiellaeota bacterium B1221]
MNLIHISKRTLMSAALTSCLISLGTLKADTIVSWDLNDITSTTSSAAADFEAAEIGPVTLALGPGLTASNWANALLALHNDAAVNSLATSITQNDYFTFSVTPDAGASLSLDHLDMVYSLGANTQPAETTFVLMSSLTGFTDSDSIESFASSLPGPANNAQGRAHTFDLSGTSELQNITSTVEFRIYMYNTGANSMTRIAIGRGFNSTPETDLLLDGTISAIPEPGTFSLLVIALAGFVLTRRRSW